jgi:uracil-xanthine permease
MSSAEVTNNSRVIYGLDDRPPIIRATVLALQHVLTMFGSTVSIPLLFGPAMGMQPEEIALLISSVMLCSGVATLIQATVGSRLPIVQGVSFSFIAAFFMIINEIVEVRGGTAGEAMQYIAGAIIAGAIVEITIGFSGMMGMVRRFLSPVVVGPVIMLIGLALFQHGAPKAGTNWAISGLTIALVIVFSLVLSRRHRLFRLFPILLAIIVVVTSCWVLTLVGFFAEGDKGFVDLTAFNNSEWVRSDVRQIVLPWGVPKFEIGFILAVLAGYMASMIESFGDYHACSQMAGGGNPTSRQISRGIGCEGIGCLLTGILGGFSSTSYSENIGLIGLTKVGSRFVVQIGAVILILLGLFAKFGAFAAAIPEPVVGGLYCALFGLISGVGVQQLAKCDLYSDRNLFIAGLALFMGLSVPAYFNSIASQQDIGPGQTLAMYNPTAQPLLAALPSTIQSIVISIGTTGMAVAAIIGLTLDNLVPGTDEERGLDTGD